MARLRPLECWADPPDDDEPLTLREGVAIAIDLALMLVGATLFVWTVVATCATWR